MVTRGGERQGELLEGGQKLGMWYVMYKMVIAANTVKVVKRVNAKSSHHKEKFSSFFPFIVSVRKDGC